MKALIYTLLVLFVSTTAGASQYKIADAEAERVAQNLKKYNALSKEERAKADEEANSLAAIAIVLFRAEEYNEARPKFEKSLDLNPTNTGLYYRYGLTLLQNKEHERGIYYVGWDTKTQAITKYYQIGVAYYNMRNKGKMYNILNTVVDQKDAKYSSLASYRLGLYEYASKNYEKAKEHFQYVLDNSQDPELDNRAELYIERIIRAQKADANKAKRWAVSAIVGAQYDSNILFTPDSVADQGNSLGDGGMRYLVGASGSGKVINEKNHDLAVALSGFYMKSQDQRFQQADPFLVGASIPYNRRMKLMGDSFTLNVSPGYETLYLDANQDNQRENILNSIVLNTTGTFILSNTRFSSYDLKLRNDDSQIAVTNSDDDSSAFKAEVSSTQTWILDTAKAKLFGAKAGAILNSAKGKNNNYYRADLSSFFSYKTGIWKMSATHQLAYYYLAYPDRTDDRADHNVDFNTTLSRPLNSWASASFQLGYSKNFSNVATNEYDKYTALLALSFATTF